MKNNTLRIVGTVALVGSLAAVALFNLTSSENNSTFLASAVDSGTVKAFNSFVSNH